MLGAVAGVVWPVGPPRVASRVIVALAVASVGVVGGLLPALVFDPQAAGCNACQSNLLEIYSPTRRRSSSPAPRRG